MSAAAALARQIIFTALKNIWSALERPEAAVVGLVGDVLAGAVRGAEGVGGEGAAGVRVPAQAVAGAGPAQPGHIVDICYIED